MMKPEERYARRMADQGRSQQFAPAAALAAGSPSSSSPLSAEDTAQAMAVLLGFDRDGNEIHLEAFKAEGYKLFGRLTHPGTIGKVLIEALSSTSGDSDDECARLGIDYPTIARAALSMGNDPAEVLKAEIEYRREHNAANPFHKFGLQKK